MDAHLSSPISYRVEPVDAFLSRIARQATALGAGLALLLCVIVVVRGWCGAFDAPDSTLFLMLAAVSGELLASAYRVVWRRLHPAATRGRVLVVRLIAPAFGLVCLASALSLVDANGWTIAGVWLVVMGGEGAWWYPEFQHRSRRRGAPRVAPLPAEFGATHPADDANVIQQITRSRTGDGIEVISGVLRAEFADGERIQNLHVAFCPPLPYEPQVTAHQLDGSPLVTKVAQSEIFGTRIELRLTQATDATARATIYFEAQPVAAVACHDPLVDGP